MGVSAESCVQRQHHVPDAVDTESEHTMLINSILDDQLSSFWIPLIHSPVFGPTSRFRATMAGQPAENGAHMRQK